MWHPQPDSDAFDWLGETPHRTAGKKNKPLRLPALDTG
jgi:hypothetical protein